MINNKEEFIPPYFAFIKKILYNINEIKEGEVKYMTDYEKLIQWLNETTEAYDKGTPIIPDRDWDAIYYNIVKMEKEQGWASPNSPT